MIHQHHTSRAISRRSLDHSRWYWAFFFHSASSRTRRSIRVLHSRLPLLPVIHAASSILAVRFFFNRTAFSFSNAPICASILAAWLFASFNSASSSERSSPRFPSPGSAWRTPWWAFNELPHFWHLYWCPSLVRRNPVRTGHADGHALASLQFGCVRCLVIVPRTGRYMAGVAVPSFSLNSASRTFSCARNVFKSISRNRRLPHRRPLLCSSFCSHGFRMRMPFGLLVFLADDDANS